MRDSLNVLLIHVSLINSFHKSVIYINWIFVGNSICGCANQTLSNVLFHQSASLSSISLFSLPVSLKHILVTLRKICPKKKHLLASQTKSCRKKKYGGWFHDRLEANVSCMLLVVIWTESFIEKWAVPFLTTSPSRNRGK